VKTRGERLTDLVTLYEGDCLDVIPTLDRVEAVLTDPPYGISYQSNMRHKADRFDVIIGDDIPQVEWMPLCKPIVSEFGCVICFCEWRYAEQFRSGLIEAGFHVGAQLVWDRVVPGMGDPLSRPSPAHDLMWFAVQGKYVLPGARPSSVYRVQRLSGHHLEHPTQKPVPLMQKIIADYTREGDTVLDPFAGSGSTAIAAMKENRRCILIEKDTKYCQVIRNRVARANGTDSNSLFRKISEDKSEGTA
jgi:DNA modification methylase